MNWFTWARLENEKTYGEWCGHKDRYVGPAHTEIDGHWIVTCSSCGSSASWTSSESYDKPLPPKKFKEIVDAEKEEE